MNLAQSSKHSDCWQASRLLEEGTGESSRFWSSKVAKRLLFTIYLKLDFPDLYTT